MRPLSLFLMVGHHIMKRGIVQTVCGIMAIFMLRRRFTMRRKIDRLFMDGWQSNGRVLLTHRQGNGAVLRLCRERLNCCPRKTHRRGSHGLWPTQSRNLTLWGYRAVNMKMTVWYWKKDRLCFSKRIKWVGMLWILRSRGRVEGTALFGFWGINTIINTLSFNEISYTIFNDT